jgi:hypothetical protein
VFAFRAGEDEVAAAWAKVAWSAGASRLVRDTYGWRLIGWTWLSPRGRSALRGSADQIRSLIARVINEPGGLLR